MSNYVKATNFTAKDSLQTGNPAKIIKGAEIDDEFNAIATAVATKPDSNSPTFTGIPIAPTASAGTNTTQLATTAFVTAVTNTLGTMSTQNKTAVDITGGTVVGITDLTVADGGTGVSTIAANAVVLGNGTSAIQTVAPGTTGNLLTSNGTTWQSTAPANTLGVNQTWQNVTRSAGQTYTNDTGRPIQVIIVIDFTNNSTGSGARNSTGSVTVGGVQIASSAGNVGTSQNFFDIPLSFSFIVPNNTTYLLTLNLTSTNAVYLVSWKELR
jgi:hypothetical protein